MLLFGLAAAVALSTSAQDAPASSWTKRAGAYQLVPRMANPVWGDECRVVWTLSDDGAFQADQNGSISTGRWHIEDEGGHPSWIVVDDLTTTASTGTCGLRMDGRLRLPLTILGNGAVFISTWGGPPEGPRRVIVPLFLLDPVPADAAPPQ